MNKRQRNIQSGPPARHRESTVLISEKINHAFNEQIGHELGNSIQYLAIAAHFERDSLFGLAKIYYTQADEEREHAMKFVKFLLDAGGKVVIPAVPAPRSEFESAVDAAQLALDSELTTTRQIYDLVTLATEEKNYIALNFLQWFVNEQLEEVSSAETRLAVIRRAGPSVLMVEAYLAHEPK
jgi:bacterioferritin B